MSLFSFLAVFTALLIFGSLAITGWFVITRGSLEVLIDGTVKRKGMIFRGWSLFWLKKRRNKTARLLTHANLNRVWGNIGKQIINTCSVSTSRPKVDNAPVVWDNEIVIYNYDIVIKEKADELEREYSIRIKLIDDSVEKNTDVHFVKIALYFVEEQYIFPEWIRKPIAGCITCFASIYGTLFYWAFLHLIRLSLFCWSDNPTLAAVFFWIVYCLSLAILNTAIAKRYKPQTNDNN